MPVEKCPKHHVTVGELAGVACCLLCFKERQEENVWRGRKLLADHVIRMEANRLAPLRKPKPHEKDDGGMSWWPKGMPL